MAITRTPIIDDSGSGTDGTVIDNAWKQEFYNQIDAAAGGVWADMPQNPGNFYAGAGGVWTVTAHNTFAYIINGKTMTISLYITTGSISGAPVELRASIPGGISVARTMAFTTNYYQAGVPGVGWGAVDPGNNYFKMLRDMVGTPWAAGTNYITTTFSFSIA